jgi:DNA-3-methyladenine glycosylase
MQSPCLTLPRSFYERDPRTVARELLGKILLRRMDARRIVAGRIVEVEAYLGKSDPAAHAYSGITARNAVLFGPAGHAYVYFTYGMHHCMNISCQPRGQAGCVLIRALEPVAGFEEMAVARNLAEKGAAELPLAKMRMLTSGPGRLCQALRIERAADNGKDVSSPKSDLQVVERLTAGSVAQEKFRIVSTTRVGISKAADMKLRYLIAGNPFVSVKP